jgi:hypothetical protein
MDMQCKSGSEGEKEREREREREKEREWEEIWISAAGLTWKERSAGPILLAMQCSKDNLLKTLM